MMPRQNFIQPISINDMLLAKRKPTQTQEERTNSSWLQFWHETDHLSLEIKAANHVPHGWTVPPRHFLSKSSLISCVVFCGRLPVPVFPDISPSSSSFCFWPDLSLLHSHCIQQILESVNHCHINGIVHRDLKVSGDSKGEKTKTCPLMAPCLASPLPDQLTK